MYIPCLILFSPTIALNSWDDGTNRYTVQSWVENVSHHMHAYLWETWKRQNSSHYQWLSCYGRGSLMTSSLFLQAKRRTSYTYLKKMNSQHPTIKFTFDYSQEKVHFLDTYVHIGDNNKLYTSLYTKPTDTHALLHYDSFHPTACKKSIIYSQALRYRMIITKDDVLKEELKNLATVLTHRGYPRNLIRDNISKINGMTQDDTLKTKNPDTSITPPPERTTVFSLPYNPSNNKIMNIIHSNWHFIENDPTLSTIWRNKPLLANKRQKNFKDTLVRAKTTSSIPHRYPGYHALHTLSRA